MWIGVRKSENRLIWSRVYIGYWTDYVVQLSNIIVDLNDGGAGKSRYQDYTPVMALLLHRWNDDC